MEIEFVRVNNDVNGNPRYVCHYSNLITDKEREDSYKASNPSKGVYGIDVQYAIAVKRAKKIGGRKFHNKQYGGGIVFQSYNLSDTIRSIKELVKEG